MINFFKNALQIGGWSLLSVVTFLFALLVYFLWPFSITKEVVIDLPKNDESVVFVRTSYTWERDGFDRSIRYSKNGKTVLETPIQMNHTAKTDVKVFWAEGYLKFQDRYGNNYLSLSHPCFKDTAKPSIVSNEFKCDFVIEDQNHNWKQLGRIHNEGELVFEQSK